LQAVGPGFEPPCLHQNKRGLAQSGSAPALGAGGRRFESYIPDHFIAQVKSAFCATGINTVEQKECVMHKCDCGKEFDSVRKLNGHKSVHRPGGRYSVSRATNPMCNCLYCDTEFRESAGTTNKYCSSECFAKHKWETQTVPRIEEGRGVNSSTLKKYLVEKRGETCEDCGTGNSWNGKALTLHLDHIDGNSDNNLLVNLRLLCPNCHSQTDTHGSKGMGSRYKKITKRNVYLREYKSNTK
jgi:hypothetical protein